MSSCDRQFQQQSACLCAWFGGLKPNSLRHQQWNCSYSPVAVAVAPEMQWTGKQFNQFKRLFQPKWLGWMRNTASFRGKDSLNVEQGLELCCNFKLVGRCWICWYICFLRTPSFTHPWMGVCCGEVVCILYSFLAQWSWDVNISSRGKIRKHGKIKEWTFERNPTGRIKKACSSYRFKNMAA